MAVALLAVLLVPLASTAQSVVERARTAPGKGEERGSILTGGELFSALEQGSANAWQWGARVVAATWETGPELKVVCARGARECQVPGGRLQVGLWVGGWFQGEHTVAEGEMQELAHVSWDAQEGRELVVRVRTQDGVWGPPWRTLIPGTGPQLVAGLRRVTPSATSAPLAGDESLIHLPGLCNPGVSVSSGIEQVEKDAAAAVLILRSVVAGRADVALGGLSQSWLAEEGRSVDVYF